MNLPRAGREYLHLYFWHLPDGAPVHVTFDQGETWHMTEGTGLERKILIAGPDMVDPEDAIVINWDTTVTVRVTDTPEVVIRTSTQIINLV